MAALFTAASSQYLTTSTAPVLVLPYSVGMWVYLNSTTSGATTRVIWSSAGGATALSLLAQNTFSTLWGLGSASPTVTFGTQTVNQWAYFVFRTLAAGSRKAAVLQFDGSIVNASDSSFSSAAVTTWTLGSTAAAAGSYFDGSIAEYWSTNTDVEIAGGDLDPNLLRQLAYCGPFSVPHISANLTDYRSMDVPIGSDTDAFPTAYMPFGRRTWTNTNGVTRASHPPLRPDYKLPNNIIKLGIV